MPVVFDILTLTIDGSVVEKIRHFGKNNLQLTVNEFKKTYNLCEDHDYVFFLTMQSKMNNNKKSVAYENTKQDYNGRN